MVCVFFFMLTPVVLLFSTFCLALDSPPDNSVSETQQNTVTVCFRPVGELMAEANRDYGQRAEPGKAQVAANLYDEILAQKPDDYEAAWRSAACYYWMGDDLPADQTKLRETVFSQGLDRAKRALETKPDSIEGNFWSGVLLGEVGNAHGIFASLWAVDPIIRSMEKVLIADPNHAFAHHVLGVVYRLAPGWPFSCGSLDKSLNYATLAVENRPDSVLTHLGLGEVLWAQGRKNDAEAELNLALALPGPPELQPETVREKKAVEELLAKIEGRKLPVCVVGENSKNEKTAPAKYLRAAEAAVMN